MSGRFPIIPAGNRSAEQAKLVDAYHAGWRKALASPDGRLGGPLDVTIYQPGFAQAIMGLSDYFRSESAISARIKELIVLLVARKARCEYEWCAHVAGARKAGWTDDVIRAVAEGKTPNFAESDDQAVYAVVTQLQADGNLGDDAFDRAKDLFGEPALIDLIALVGYYNLIALFMNVAGVRHPNQGSLDIPLPSRPRSAN